MLRPQARLPSALPTLIQERSPPKEIYARRRASKVIQNIWGLCFPFDTPNFSTLKFSRDMKGFVYFTDNRLGVCVNFREILYSTRLYFWRAPVISCAEKYLKRQLTVFILTEFVCETRSVWCLWIRWSWTIPAFYVCVDAGIILKSVYIFIIKEWNLHNVILLSGPALSKSVINSK